MWHGACCIGAACRASKVHDQLCIWRGALPVDGHLVFWWVLALRLLHTHRGPPMLAHVMMEDFMPAALCPCPPCHLQDYYDELIRHYRYQKRVGGAPQGRPAGPRAAHYHAAMCC